MKDKELDDLFRRNADYLADESPRDFDKDAFWQQLQTELPKKADRRKKGAAWWWAAASVILAGMLGGLWWMQSAGLDAENKLAGKIEVKKIPWSVSPQTRDDAVGVWRDTSIRHRPRTSKGSVSETTIAAIRKETSPNPFLERENSGKKLLVKKEKVPRHSILPNTEENTVQPIETALIEKPLLPENEHPLPEVAAPAVLEKPVYRVVHINEIRQRKQQEARAQSRMAFRIGLPSGSQVTTQSANKPLLNIPIQH